MNYCKQYLELKRYWTVTVKLHYRLNFQGVVWKDLEKFTKHLARNAGFQRRFLPNTSPLLLGHFTDVSGRSLTGLLETN